MVVLLLATTALYAGDCIQECADAAGCIGGCSIDSYECGVACWGSGCSYNCKIFSGPDCEAATIAGECVRKRPPLGAGPVVLSHDTTRDAAGFQWAILEHPPVPGGTLRASDVRVLASASPSAAAAALERFVGDYNSEMHAQVEADTRPASARVAPERVLYSFGARSPVRPRLVIDERHLGDPAAAGTSGFFRGVTDASGAIVSLEPLYSDAPRSLAPLAAFVRQHVRVTTAGRPSEFFGYFASTARGNDLSAMVTSADAR